jgi:hypothetical protein
MMPCAKRTLYWRTGQLYITWSPLSDQKTDQDLIGAGQHADCQSETTGSTNATFSSDPASLTHILLQQHEQAKTIAEDAEFRPIDKHTSITLSRPRNYLLYILHTEFVRRIAGTGKLQSKWLCCASLSILKPRADRSTSKFQYGTNGESTPNAQSWHTCLINGPQRRLLHKYTTF